MTDRKNTCSGWRSEHAPLFRPGVREKLRLHRGYSRIMFGIVIGINVLVVGAIVFLHAINYMAEKRREAYRERTRPYKTLKQSPTHLTGFEERG